MRARRALYWIVAAAMVASAAAPAIAGEAKNAEAEVELTPEEKAERESRKACKVAICDAFYNRDPSGGDIACHIVKTWRKEHLQKIVSKAQGLMAVGPRAVHVGHKAEAGYAHQGDDRAEA